MDIYGIDECGGSESNETSTAAGTVPSWNARSVILILSRTPESAGCVSLLHPASCNGSAAVRGRVAGRVASLSHARNHATDFLDNCLDVCVPIHPPSKPEYGRFRHVHALKSTWAAIRG